MLSESQGPTSPAASPPEGTIRGPRWLRTLGAGVGLGIAIVAVWLLPDLLWAIPYEVQRPIHLWSQFAGLVVAGVFLTVPQAPPLAVRVLRWIGDRLGSYAARFRPIAALAGGAVRATRAVASAVPRQTLAELDRPAAWILRGPLAVVVGALALLLLVIWVPEFLTWPLWVDHDQFAMTAQSWDFGIRPYRDLKDFDFPGPIYLFWALGKVFGWEWRTVPYLAINAAALVFLGVSMAVWSRRIFGRALPGLLGYIMVLAYYLGLDYTQTSQRDWRAPLLIVLGLLTLQAWPGRFGRLSSGLATAAAFAFRPHVILLIPALVSAVDEGVRRLGGTDRQSVRALAGWAAAFAASGLLVFSPLILAGVLDDFARVIQVANYGNSYNEATVDSFSAGLRAELAIPWMSTVLVANVLLGALGPGPFRFTARTWSLALIGILLYKPLSPVQHQYLNHPLLGLVWPINVAVLLGWILTIRLPAPGATLRLLLVAWMIHYALPRVPKYCNPSRSLQALDPLIHGYQPVASPQGSERILWTDRPGFIYNWTNYRAVLSYLRYSTNPGTRVANVLRGLPYPAINGPAGRITPFPAAGGVIYPSVDPEARDRMLAEALERAPDDSVVVWIPHEPNVYNEGKCTILTRAIHRLYRPEVRFGWLEIWRRKTGADPVREAEPSPTAASASAP